MDPTVGECRIPLITKARAVLITESGKLLLIRRQPPEQDHTWWVLPGGGIDPEDNSLEDAACREVLEATGGELSIHSLVQIAETRTWQAIFLGRIIGADEAKRSGPELTDGSGSYFFDEQPLDAGVLSGLDLWPLPTHDWLTARLAEGADLFTLPDLRTTEILRWAPEPHERAEVQV